MERETVMKLNQELARALGDPTRYNIADFIARSNHPVSIAELTEFVGLNHNAVRQHLTQLKRVGIVSESIEGRTLPGRPRLLYRINFEIAGRFGLPGPYEYLARILAESVASGLTTRDLGRREGIEEVDEAKVGPTPVCGVVRRDPFDVLEDSLAARGFDPMRRDSVGMPDLVLASCPFVQVAMHYPDVVCGVHRGLIEGVYAGSGGQGVVELTPKNPKLAGCIVSVIQALCETGT